MLASGGLAGPGRIFLTLTQDVQQALLTSESHVPARQLSNAPGSSEGGLGVSTECPALLEWVCPSVGDTQRPQLLVVVT